MTKSIVYLFLLSISLAGRAQGVLRLPDAVNIALKNSLDIQLATNAVEANTILNNIGVAGGLPLVTGAVADNEQSSTINQKLNTGVLIDRNAAATNNLSSSLGVSM